MIVVTVQTSFEVVAIGPRVSLTEAPDLFGSTLHFDTFGTDITITDLSVSTTPLVSRCLPTHPTFKTLECLLHDRLLDTDYRVGNRNRSQYQTYN